MSGYPSAAARPRGVLVRGIPGLATEADVDEFFSFCGAIESKRLSTVPPADAGSSPTLEAIVVFADEASRRTALLMHESSILDAPVAITPIPDDYTAGATPGGARSAPPQAAAGFGALFSGVSTLFNDVGQSLSGEMAKAGAMLDAATETGVLKSAKDQAELARKKTVELMHNVDEQYHVGQRAGAVAGAVTQQTRSVATVVAEQSRNIATQVDSTLHLSEHTRALGEKAMQNDAVSTSVNSVRTGIDTLLSQTGLTNPSNGDVPPAAAPGAAEPRAPQAPASDASAAPAST